MWCNSLGHDGRHGAAAERAVVPAGRLYRLQIARGEEYSAKSVANFVKEIRVKADRGIIKDRRGEILTGFACSLPL